MSTFEIGTQVIGQSGATGVICALHTPETKSFVLSGGMTPIQHEYEIAWRSGRVERLPDSIIKPFVERATHLPKVENVADFKAEMLALQETTRFANNAANEAARERTRAFRIDAAKRIPSWAKAVICAEMIEDRSDAMSDYFGSTTTRTVILGFSAHTRDLFPELRKFAATFPETVELATAPESAEHRQKYSMGAGYFLKSGYRNSTGWQVRKHKLWGDNPADSIPYGEWHVAAAPTVVEQVNSPAADSGKMTIEKHVHTKRGFDMWIVVLADRVERPEYDAMLQAAKSLGGWYSAKWGTTPGGFAFKSESSAVQFVSDRSGSQIAAIAPVDPGKLAKIAPTADMSAKLNQLADAMDSDIQHKFADRQTNTPKRQREAASARHEGNRLKRTQAALRALALLHSSGNVPALLSSLKTKAAVYGLCGSQIDRSNAGYYDAGFDTGKPAIQTPQAIALWALLAAPTDEEKRADELRVKVDKLIFANIPGYFPTPAAIIADMIEEAEIDDTVKDILEPEAGSGAILDALRTAAPQAELVAYERHNSLRDILQLKGYTLAGSDFMDCDTSRKFDRVLMNPPFENGQDIEHIMKAFSCLRSGGKLVAIMSLGPFFRRDRKSVAFREWFDDLGGETLDIPAGAFKESGTGIATVMVTLFND